MSTACTIGDFLIPVSPMLLTALEETPCNPNAEALQRVVKTNVNAVFMLKNRLDESAVKSAFIKTNYE
jgi:hypothetical protein